MALFLEHEVHSQNNEAEAHDVIPLDGFFQKEESKTHKNRKAYDLLYDLELIGTELGDAYTVGRYHEAVLKEGYAPTDEYHLPDGRGCTMVLQVSIPCIGHEHITDDEQDYGAHI